MSAPRDGTTRTPAWAALALGLAVGVALDAEAARPKKRKPKAPPPVVAPTPRADAPAEPALLVTDVPPPGAPPLDADTFVGPVLPRALVEAESLPTLAPPDVAVLGRRQSAVTPGSESRWSNRGAMVPVVAEVELSVPLPARAVPLLPGQATPGQRLVADGERLTAHLSAYAEYLETVRQDDVLGTVRGRAVLHYDRIANGDFGLHLDLDYRGSAGALRLDDRRLNAANVTWGLTDFRRNDGPAFGLGLGRLLVREAGLARVDGLLVRGRVSSALKLGAYGGVTGNPYGYNWRLARTEDISTRFIAAGLFSSLRLGPVFADLSVGGSYANIPAEGGAPARSGLDRVFVFVDAGWAASPALDLFLSGWLDVLPGGQPVQNVELSGLWQPSRAGSLRASVSRFSTLAYAVSSDLSYRYDATGSSIANPAGGPPLVAVDTQGAPIVAYDERFVRATYTAAELRGGYRFGAVEPYGLVSVQLRESGAPGSVAFATLRMLPSLGLTLRDPDVVDLFAQVTGIVDAETERRLVLTGGASRTFGDVRLGADARAFFGGAGAVDGGFELGYTLPRDWLPGRLLLRAMFRYFREDVVLRRLPDACAVGVGAATCPDILSPGQNLPLVPMQESFYGTAGVDWRY
jgi:hypothetical protein